MASVIGEKFWEKSLFAKAERQYYEMLCKNVKFGAANIHHESVRLATMNKSGKYIKSKKIVRKTFSSGCENSLPANRQNILVSEIAKAREHIKNSLDKLEPFYIKMGGMETTLILTSILERLQLIEMENSKLKKTIANLKELHLDSEKRIIVLEKFIENKPPISTTVEEQDDGVDLFASESDDENKEAARIREERLAAYAAKKAKKPVLIAKSSLVLDVKPWDDETDLKKMEDEIRKISADGLLWGASKLVPVAFGISKLSIGCVVEDDKISIDWLTEEIEKNEDFVQSVDVAAFNKI